MGDFPKGTKKTLVNGRTKGITYTHPVANPFPASKDPRLHISRGKRPHGAPSMARGRKRMQSLSSLWSHVSEASYRCLVLCCIIIATYLQRVFAIVQELQENLFLNILEQGKKKSLTGDTIQHPTPSHL